MFERGDIVLAQGSATGRLLFLKQGAVDIVMEEVFLTRVIEPGLGVRRRGAVCSNQKLVRSVSAVQSSSFYVVEDAKGFCAPSRLQRSISPLCSRAG